MIPDEVWKLVPNTLPEGMEDWALAIARRARFTERQFFAYAWAHQLLRRASTPGALSTAIRGTIGGRADLAIVVDISAGFVPFQRLMQGDNLSRNTVVPALQAAGSGIPTVDSDGTSFTFGVVVGIEGAGDRGKPDVGAIVGGRFPIIVESREVRRAAPLAPVGHARSACYAVPSSSSLFHNGIPWSDGIVTARHVLTPPSDVIGASVPMATGAPAATVVEISGSSIDAIVLAPSAGSYLPATAAPLALATAVAPGSRVRVDASSPFHADVLRIMDHPTYFGPMCGHRAFIDAVGIFGDSGSLVQDASNDAVGIYMGKTDPPTEGIVQLLQQPCAYFSMSLYI